MAASTIAIHSTTELRKAVEQQRLLDKSFETLPAAVRELLNTWAYYYNDESGAIHKRLLTGEESSGCSISVFWDAPSLLFEEDYGFEDRTQQRRRELLEAAYAWKTSEDPWFILKIPSDEVSSSATRGHPWPQVAAPAPIAPASQGKEASLQDLTISDDDDELAPGAAPSQIPQFEQQHMHVPEHEQPRVATQPMPAAGRGAQSSNATDTAAPVIPITLANLSSCGVSEHLTRQFYTSLNSAQQALVLYGMNYFASRCVTTGTDNVAKWQSIKQKRSNCAFAAFLDDSCGALLENNTGSQLCPLYQEACRISDDPNNDPRTLQDQPFPLLPEQCRTNLCTLFGGAPSAATAWAQATDTQHYPNDPNKPRRVLLHQAFVASHPNLFDNAFLQICEQFISVAPAVAPASVSEQPQSMVPQPQVQQMQPASSHQTTQANSTNPFGVGSSSDARLPSAEEAMREFFARTYDQQRGAPDQQTTQSQATHFQHRFDFLSPATRSGIGRAQGADEATARTVYDCSMPDAKHVLVQQAQEQKKAQAAATSRETNGGRHVGAAPAPWRPNAQQGGVRVEKFIPLPTQQREFSTQTQSRAPSNPLVAAMCAGQPTVAASVVTKSGTIVAQAGTQTPLRLREAAESRTQFTQLETPDRIALQQHVVQMGIEPSMAPSFYDQCGNAEERKEWLKTAHGIDTQVATQSSTASADTRSTTATPTTTSYAPVYVPPAASIQSQRGNPFLAPTSNYGAAGSSYHSAAIPPNATGQQPSRLEQLKRDLKVTPIILFGYQQPEPITVPQPECDLYFAQRSTTEASTRFQPVTQTAMLQRGNPPAPVQQPFMMWTQQPAGGGAFIPVPQAQPPSRNPFQGPSSYMAQPPAQQPLQVPSQMVAGRGGDGRAAPAVINPQFGRGVFALGGNGATAARPPVYRGAAQPGAHTQQQPPSWAPPGGRGQW